MFSKLTVIAAVFAGLAVAQNNTTYIDPTSVDLSTRNSWCNGEFSSCGYLCFGDATTNTCDGTTLDYSCICSNGTAPGLQYYENTLATYICQESYAQCVKLHPDDLAGQDLCKTDISDNCGTLDATNVTAPVTTTSSSSSTSATASATSATVASSSATATGAATALKYGSEYGLGVAAAAGAAAFGLLL